MGLEAVIFDMDGVLCFTDEYHFQSWKRMADTFGIPFTREDNEALRGLTRERSLELILKGERLRAEEQLQAMMDLKNNCFQELIQEMTPEDLAEGAAALLNELSSAGLKIGVASASRNVKAVLERLGITETIQAYCDGNIAHRSKPDPFTYLYTAQALDTHPSRCIAIEDSQAGVQAARTAGMCVIGLGPAERVGQADAVFDGLAGVGLKDLLEVYAAWKTDGRPAQDYQYLIRP